MRSSGHDISCRKRDLFGCEEKQMLKSHVWSLTPKTLRDSNRFSLLRTNIVFFGRPGSKSCEPTNCIKIFLVSKIEVEFHGWWDQRGSSLKCLKVLICFQLTQFFSVQFVFFSCQTGFPREKKNNLKLDLWWTWALFFHNMILHEQHHAFLQSGDLFYLMFFLTKHAGASRAAIDIKINLERMFSFQSRLHSVRRKLFFRCFYGVASGPCWVLALFFFVLSICSFLREAFQWTPTLFVFDSVQPWTKSTCNDVFFPKQCSNLKEPRNFCRKKTGKNRVEFGGDHCHFLRCVKSGGVCLK